jgi:hypothetical protein
VAALLVSLGLRGQAVVKRIADTAQPAGPTTLFGAGIVDAKAAVAGLGRPGATTSTDPGGSGSGAGSPGVSGQTVRASASMKARQRIRAALRHGIRVRCHSSVDGVCRVVVKARGKTIASGSHRVKAGKTVVFYARLNRAGRRLLSRSRRLTARAEFVLPGPAKLAQSISFRR